MPLRLLMASAALLAQAVSPPAASDPPPEPNAVTVVAQRLPPEVVVMAPCRLPSDLPWPAAAFDAPTRPGPRTKAYPGTEQWMLNEQKSMSATGHGDYDRMSVRLADALEHLRPLEYQRFKCLGRFRGMRFLHVSADGLDDYELDYDHGSGEEAIGPLTSNGRADTLMFRLYQPQPATEELRLAITSIQDGKPRYDTMSPALASVVTQQWPALQPAFRRWGRLETVYFVRQEPDGAYLFTLVFDHGRSGWRVPELTDGRLTALQYEVYEGPGGG